MRFLGKHWFMVVGLIAIGSCSIGVGLKDNPGQGFILFGVGSAVLATIYWMATSE